MKGWDYSSSGWYFITICIDNRQHLFGEIVHNQMEYTELGHFAAASWLAMYRVYDVLIPNVWVIMPNHVHLLMGINAKPNKEYETNEFQKMIANSISSIANHFKGRITKYTNKEKIEFEWQSRFYDHIIRNQKEYETIQHYIQTNPQNWDTDKFNICK